MNVVILNYNNYYNLCTIPFCLLQAVSESEVFCVFVTIETPEFLFLFLNFQYHYMVVQVHLHYINHADKNHNHNKNRKITIKGQASSDFIGLEYMYKRMFKTKLMLGFMMSLDITECM